LPGASAPRGLQAAVKRLIGPTCDERSVALAARQTWLIAWSTTGAGTPHLVEELRLYVYFLGLARVDAQP
jgi:hypothetical protein